MPSNLHYVTFVIVPAAIGWAMIISTCDDFSELIVCRQQIPFNTFSYPSPSTKVHSKLRHHIINQRVSFRYSMLHGKR